MAAASAMIGVAGLAACASAVLVGAVRRWADHRLLDLPNERSSHAHPTPRGGGLGIGATISAGLAAGAYHGLDGRWLAVAAGGLAVAAVSFADDLRPLAPWVRLAVGSTAS